MPEAANTRTRYPDLAAWEAAHPLLYASGDDVRVGDWVDFGFDGKFANGPNIDLMGQPWVGQVVKRDGAYVVVDTALNSYGRFEPGQLTLVNRQQEQVEDD